MNFDLKTNLIVRGDESSFRI